MKHELAADILVRRVRHDEWRQVRALRLDALRDPIASVAFLETVEQALARPDEEWRSRTVSHAEGKRSVQFVAERGGTWIGSLTVFVRAAGVPDYFDRILDIDLPTVVGVFVAPSGRGLGVIDALLASAAGWAHDRGDRLLTLDVHESNLPAIRAYERAGFEPRGEFVTPDGREVGMVKDLTAAK
ncbi:MAG: GNAT family N-acetyltransferase [Pseudolysinimonas sp.]